MIDNTNNGNSNQALATALRDRSRCTIPNQPNRSLPIRPAPNGPCRGIPPRRTLQTQSFKLNTTIEPESTQLSSVSTSSDNSTKKDQTTGHIRIEVPSWQNDIRQPYISVINICNSLDKATSNALKRAAPRSPENSSTSNCNLIDISQSPDRTDCSKLDSTSSNLNSSKDSNSEQENCTKKKRRKRLKRDDGKSVEIDLVSPPSKIVPPLRLKKIQSLQDEVSTCGSNWGNVSKSEETQEVTPGFRFYQPRPQEEPINNDASKYRIVTGTTPPCDAHIDSSTDQLTTRDKSDQSDKKLHTRENKVKFKLSELQNKIAELGREMLRIASTSPNNSVRQTIDSYGDQIDKLTKLLKKSSDTAPKPDADSQFEDVVPVSMVSSTVSTTHSLSMPIITSTPSPEPPKLSPQSSITTLEMRNTPPVLAKATVNSEDDTDDPLKEFDGLRGFVTINKRLKPRKTQENSSPLVASSIITTTTENTISDLDSKPEILAIELNDNTPQQVNQGMDLSIVNAKIIDVKSLAKCPEMYDDIKIDVRSTPSPGEMIIDTTSVLEEFENRSEPAIDATITESVTLAENLTVQVSQADVIRIQTPTPIISSSCEPSGQGTSVSSNSNNSGNNNSNYTSNNTSNNLNGCLDVTVAKDFIIGDQFPTLANWLATTTNKVANDKKLPNELTVIRTSKTPAPFQAQIQVCIPGGVKITPIDLTATTTTITTATTTSTTITTTTNGAPLANSGGQWRDQRWEAPDQRYQQPQPPPEYMNGAVAMNNVQISGQQQHQPIRSDYCAPPVNLDRYYPRNYPMDPYSLPYGYSHATLAASMWGGGVMQYPVLRPRGLPQGYPPRYPNTPMQYNMPPSSLPQPRVPPPLYPISTQAQTSQESKIASHDNQRGNNPPPLRQSMANSSNTNNPRMYQQSQQVPARDQYARMYTEQMNRAPLMPEMSREQMNSYRQQWRGGMLPPGPLPLRNYPVNANWASDPCSLLAALSPAALQNFTVPMPVAPRQRPTKELTVDQIRNCETPHLRKITYSPNTARTLECSNCSLPGPSFKCLGCEVAFYCDENCQARHWSKHVASCPKKMPKLKKVVP